MKKKLLICLITLLMIVCSAFTLVGCKDEATLKFKTLQVEGTNVSGVVSNDVTSFSFAKEIAITGDTNFIVSLDEYGILTSYTKTVPLNSGDNVIYIFATIGETTKTFIVNIRRLPLYTVDFDTEGGSVVDSQSIEENSLASRPKPNPTKAGYTFVGWDYDFDTPVTSNLTVKAKWHANTYNVTYDANGGTASKQNDSFVFGKEYSLATAERFGYDFEGWYYQEAKVDDPTWNIAKHVTLVAEWKSNAYTVTYDANGGECEKQTETAYYKEQFSPAIPKKPGYDFMGWYLDGEKYEDSIYNFTHDISLVARWQEATFTVTYDANGGIASKIVDFATYKSSFTLATAEKVGYVFVGWFNGNNIVENGIWDITEDVTLVARWNAIFEISDGVITGLTNYGKTLNSLLIPAKLGGVKITGIGEEAFYNCTTVSSVTITEDCAIDSVGANAFHGTAFYNNQANWENGALYIGKVLYEVNKDTLSDKFIIKEGTTVIADKAFYGCTNLTEIEILETIISIGNSSFEGCSNLSSVTFAKDSQLKTIGEYAFSRSAISEIEIPENVKAIGKNTFSNCTRLSNVTFAEGSRLEIIGEDAFSNTAYYAKLSNWENGVLYINNILHKASQFFTASKYAIKDGTISISNKAFSNCSNLTEVEIPTSVKIIGSEAFASCDKLIDIRYNGTIGEWESVAKNTDWKPQNVEITFLKERVWQSTVSENDIIASGWRKQITGKNQVIDACSLDGGLYGKTEGKFYKAVQGTEDALAVTIKPQGELEIYQQYVGLGYKLRFQFLMTTEDGQWHDTSRPPVVETIDGQTINVGINGLRTWRTVELDFDTVISKYDKLIAWNATDGANGSMANYLLRTYKGLAVTRTEDKSVIIYISAIDIVAPRTPIV